MLKFLYRYWFECLNFNIYTIPSNDIEKVEMVYFFVVYF